MGLHAVELGILSEFFRFFPATIRWMAEDEVAQTREALVDFFEENYLLMHEGLVGEIGTQRMGWALTRLTYLAERAHDLRRGCLVDFAVNNEALETTERPQLLAVVDESGRTGGIKRLVTQVV